MLFHNSCLKLFNVVYICHNMFICSMVPHGACLMLLDLLVLQIGNEGVIHTDYE